MPDFGINTFGVYLSLGLCAVALIAAFFVLLDADPRVKRVTRKDQ